ncbi:MAG TPA: VTT domain-containing protein [Ktedonobacteraceae bacterium]
MMGKLMAFFHLHLLTLAYLPFAALISIDTLRNILATVGYPAVALFILIESAGIPFPGETMLLLASFYAAVDHKLQIPIVIACAALGAIIGDNLGFLAGRTGGYALVQRFGRYLFIKPHHLQRAQRFFARHGNKTVFLGRFIAVLRAWAAFLAGVNRMRWSIFLFYNAAGGILWAIIYGCLGFFAGRFFHDNFNAVEQIARTISWTGAIVIGVAISTLYIFWRLRRRRHAMQKNSAPQESTPETATPSNAPEQPASTSQQIDSPHATEMVQEKTHAQAEDAQSTEPPSQDAPLET